MDRSVRAWVVTCVALLALALATPVAEAAFPGENGKIAFAARSFTVTGDGDSEIFTMNPDGSGLTQLTHNSANDRDPAWSPDGTHIAFYSDRDGEPGEGDLYTMNADGSDVVQITDMPGPSGDSQPSWSPDGQRLAFHRRIVDAAGRHSSFVYLINADGTNPVQVTGGPREESLASKAVSQPAWSPDGERIAVLWAPNSDDDRIRVINPDGTGATDIRHGGDPNWSPDGSKIVFRIGSAISTMNADGSQVTRLKSGHDAFRAGTPAWSPDGTMIVYTQNLQLGSVSSYGGDIFVMTASGGGDTNLTNTTGSIEGSPDWQPLPFKNASKKCKTFPGSYRNHGQCVKANR